MLFALGLAAHSAWSAEKVVLQLRWDHQFQFAGYYAAEWQGYYRDAGLDVEIRSVFDENGKFRSVTDEVAERRADFGTGAVDIVKARAEGKPLIVVASVFQKSPVAFYAKQGTRLESPSDLAHLRVATRGPDGAAGVELNAMLRAESIDPATIRTQAIRTRLGLIDLAEGYADVVSGYTISAPWVAQERGLKLIALRPATYGVDFYGSAIFAHRALADENPDLIRKFVAASLKGWEYAVRNSDAVAKRIAETLPRTVPISDREGFNRSQIEPVVQLTHYPIVQLGHTNPARWARMHEALHQAGLTDTRFDANDFIFTPQRLNEIRRQRYETFTFSGFFVLVVFGLGGWGWSARRQLVQRRHANAVLRESEERFRDFAKISSDWLWELDAEFRFTSPSGYPTAGSNGDPNMVGKTPWEFFDIDLNRQPDWKHLETCMRKGEPFRDLAISTKVPNGKVYHVRISATPVLDPDGKLIGCRGTARDVTRLVQQEEQLRQSQKLESIGRLTGGIAHDFNNVLGIMMGNLDLIRDEIDTDSKLGRLVKPAIAAAERGAALTHRLLAFARKQALEVKSVDIRDLVHGMEPLIRRSLGESVDIEVVDSAGLWQCAVDPNQLEQAILNLAINARDAMPADGGRLTIETSNARLDDAYAAAQADVKPGQYVMLAVSDTGCGIPPEQLDHIFEPFFTTKELGKRTGLGLSMVYGFVKQSSGHIAVYSEPGKGTTFKIYLPRVHATAETSEGAGTASDRETGDGECILVVEDHKDLRNMVCTMLDSLGYRTRQASDARQALGALDGDRAVQVLLTDVVLPGGTNGRELATEVVALCPDIKVVYMSGYTDNAIVHHGRLDAGIHLLQKPFRKEDLAKKLRQVLSER